MPGVGHDGELLFTLQLSPPKTYHNCGYMSPVVMIPNEYKDPLCPQCEEKRNNA